MPVVIRPYAAIDDNIGSLFNVGDLCHPLFVSNPFSPALTLPSSSEKPLSSLQSWARVPIKGLCATLQPMLRCTYYNSSWRDDFFL